MLIHFLRHAEAEDEVDSDFNRRLTTKGLEQADRPRANDQGVDFKGFGGSGQGAGVWGGALRPARL